MNKEIKIKVATGDAIEVINKAKLNRIPNYEFNNCLLDVQSIAINYFCNLLSVYKVDFKLKKGFNE